MLGYECEHVLLCFYLYDAPLTHPWRTIDAILWVDLKMFWKRFLAFIFFCNFREKWYIGVLEYRKFNDNLLEAEFWHQCRLIWHKRCVITSHMTRINEFVISFFIFRIERYRMHQKCTDVNRCMFLKASFFHDTHLAHPWRLLTHMWRIFTGNDESNGIAIVFRCFIFKFFIYYKMLKAYFLCQICCWFRICNELFSWTNT